MCRSWWLWSATIVVIVLLWLAGLLLWLLGVAALAVVLWGGWWVWWQLPRRQADRLRAEIPDAKARADVEDNYRKTISQIFGGAAVLVGAAFAYWQFTQQQRTTREQLNQQREAAQTLLISNQVSKGFEQLGSDKLAIRLGGIYALEGVMNNSEQYRQPVLEALSAFIRDETKSKTGDAPPTTEVQAALTVIGRRTMAAKGVDLTNAHIPKAHLTSAELTDALLVGTDLSEAKLLGAKLHRALLIDADLKGADLATAHLTGGAWLTRANLTNAILFNADLSDANLGPIEIDVTGFTLLKPFRVNGANLTDAHLTGANLANAHLDNADLTGADLGQVKNLTQSQLDRACGSNVKVDPPLTFHDKPCPKQ